MIRRLLRETVYKYKRKLFNQQNVAYFSSNENPIKVLFFGNDTFSLPSIKALYNSSLNNSKVSSLGVVTSLKSPANCIKRYAERSQIPLFGWPVDRDTCRQFDLGIVVSFGHLIPEDIIRAFPIGMINVHASILPRWRGAAPIIHAIMSGDKVTGVSIMKIEPNKFDIGEIYAQKEVEIEPNVLLPELHNRLANEGAELLITTLNSYPTSFQNPKKQLENEVTYAPKIPDSLPEVKWNSATAIEVYNLYRALYGYKYLTTKFQDLSINLVELQLGPNMDANVSDPGIFERVWSNGNLRVFCKGGTTIEILKVKVEGKRVMKARDFVNGFLKDTSKKCYVFR